MTEHEKALAGMEYDYLDAELSAHKLRAMALCQKLNATDVRDAAGREALIRETGKALGFKTSTPKVKDLCDSAIAYAIELGELTEGDQMIK